MRAKLIEAAEAVRCEFGVHDRARVKETVGDTAVLTSHFKMQQPNYL